MSVVARIGAAPSVALAGAVAATAFVLISGSATPAATPGLVAAFSFDEGSGSTVADLSGNGNNGTVANTTWAAAGKYGKALSFNGTSAPGDDPRLGLAAPDQRR